MGSIIAFLSASNLLDPIIAYSSDEPNPLDYERWQKCRFIDCLFQNDNW